MLEQFSINAIEMAIRFLGQATFTNIIDANRAADIHRNLRQVILLEGVLKAESSGADDDDFYSDAERSEAEYTGDQWDRSESSEEYE